MTTTKILVVDNYDSFVYTLVGYLQELGAETTVVRNDDVTLAEAIELASTRDGVLISPGPGNPAEAGVCIELIKWCGENSVAMFGVCLGHQSIGAAFGGRIVRAQQLMHGKVSEITTTREGVFSGLPQRFTVNRYHSLAIERELYLEFREPGFAPAPLLEHLVTAGYLGRKTKRGFRDYTSR